MISQYKKNKEKTDLIDPNLVKNGEAVKLGYKRNGKDVYGKLIETTLDIIPSSERIVTLPHGISEYDEIWIDKSESYLRNGDYIITFPALYYNNTDKDSIDIQIHSTNIRFIADTGWGPSWTKYIFIKFTK